MLLWHARGSWMDSTATANGVETGGWETYFECLKGAQSEGNGVGWQKVDGDPQDRELLTKLKEIDAATQSEHAEVAKAMPHPPDLALWQWLRGAVSSRTFLLPPCPGASNPSYALVPLADLFNHEFGNTEVLVSGRGDAREGGGGGAEGVFELRAGRPFRAGEQVTISYGAMSNAELLMGYGFVDAENPLDCVTMPLATLQAALEEVGAGGALPGEPGEWSGAAEALRIYAHGEDEALMLCLKTLCGLHPPPSPAPSIEQQCLPWLLLARACELRLAEYPTSLEEDEVELGRAMGLLECEAGGPEEAATRSKSCALVLFRALQKGLLVECAARVRYFAAKSVELGKLLEANVMEVQG